VRTAFYCIDQPVPKRKSPRLFFHPPHKELGVRRIAISSPPVLITDSRPKAPENASSEAFARLGPLTDKPHDDNLLCWLAGSRGKSAEAARKRRCRSSAEYRTSLAL